MMGQWNAGTDNGTVMEHCRCHGHVRRALLGMQQTATYASPHILLNHATCVFFVGNALSSHIHIFIVQAMSDTLNFKFDTD